MHRTVFNICKRIVYMGALCVPLYAVGNPKQDTIEVIDLDKITVTETGGARQTIAPTEKKLTTESGKRVVSEKSGLSDDAVTQLNIEASKLVLGAYEMLQKTKVHSFHQELQQKLSTARAVLLFPSLLKASFFFSFGGGDGMLLVRDSAGNWSYPSFYSASNVGIGLQFGASSNSIITVIQNQQALDNLLQRQVKVEASMNAAVGNVGDGQGFAFSISTYSINKGATIGVAFDGQALTQKADLNEGYYSASGANTQTIIYDQVFSNPDADNLRQILQDLSISTE